MRRHPISPVSERNVKRDILVAVVALLVGAAFGAGFTVSHVDHELRAYSRANAVANCTQLARGRVEGRRRAQVTRTLQSALADFALEAAAARRSTGHEGVARKYERIAERVERVVPVDLPLITCVDGRAIPVPDKP